MVLAEGGRVMTSRRGRSQGWAALAVVIGALLLFWAPAGASSIGAGSAVSAAADREPAECRRPCGGCPERDERAERPPAPEPTAPPRCVERPGCPCGQAGAPGRPPSGANQPPSQPPPASPPAAQGPPPAQPAPSAPPGPSPAAPAPGPATEAASPGNRPAQAASTPPPTRPATQVAGQQSAAAPRHPARALPRTGARSRLVAMVGMAWIIGGLALMATGHIRRLSPVKR